MPEPVVVGYRRSFLGFCCVGALAFVAAAPLVVLRASATGGRDLAIGLGFAVVDILFFGSALRWAWGRLLKATPALVISDQGLDERSNMGSPGFIAWDEISGIGRDGWLWGRFLTIELKDRRAFAKRLPVWLRLYMLANVLLGYGLVGIPLTTVDMPARQLDALLRERWDAAQASSWNRRNGRGGSINEIG
jgi:hypothetical protein